MTASISKVFSLSAPTPAPTLKDQGLISASNYKFLQQEVYRDSGIVLDEDKHYLLESRLTPLLREVKIATLDGLCERLRGRTSLALSRQVMEALTTNETLFFRDMAPFEALQQQVLPDVLGGLAPSEPLKIWSAAASSGQEAYSIAMLLQEQRQKIPVTILGTDISEQILVTARAGRYVQFEVNRGLPAMYLVKYFDRDAEQWQIREEIRRMVTFRQFDLRQSAASLGSFHVIFCRNVLIYFDLETKAKILDQLCRVLKPGGYLFLGGAESILHLQDRLERVSCAGTSIYRKR